jgi:ABC-2 type transport system permease protein
MPGSIFLETLRRHWRGIFWWSIGFGMVGGLQALILQDVTALQQIANLMEALPPFLVDAFAGGDAQYLATPEGYMGFRFYSLALLIFATYAVMAGLNVTANEEDRGQLDILLSLPVTRTRLMLEKLAAFALIIVGITLLTGLIIMSAVAISPLQGQFDSGRLWGATLNILPGTLLILAFTIFTGVLFQNRSRALTVTSVFVAASYFLDLLANTAPDSFLGGLRAISFFRYYDGVAAMRDGMNWSSVALLMLATVVLIGSSMYVFNRRDVSV